MSLSCFVTLTWSYCGFMRGSWLLSFFVSKQLCSNHTYWQLCRVLGCVNLDPLSLTCSWASTEPGTQRQLWPLIPSPSQSPLSPLPPGSVTGKFSSSYASPKFSHYSLLFSLLITTLFPIVCVTNCFEGQMYKTYNARGINSVQSQEQNKNSSSLQFWRSS